MRTLLLSLLVCTAACRTSDLGVCKGQSDCAAGTFCDLAQETPVCVAEPGACLPACDNGKVCRDGACVQTSCSPACDSAHVCDQASFTCVAVAAPQVAITAPAAGAFVENPLPVTATARAPGGVASVRFDLRRGGTLVASALGAVSATDPQRYAASLPLAGVADGAASLTAVMTYGQASAVSSPVAVHVDQTAPTVTLQTDGRTALLAGGAVATVRATVTDGAGSGVVASSVQLAIAGHAALAGTAGAAGLFTFSVPVDDALAAAGTSATLPFQLSARDAAGHLATLGGDPREVVRVDRDAPQFSLISVTTPADYTSAAGRKYFDPASAPLTVIGTITDGAGVDPATVCLRLAGETGACARPGSAGPNNTWTFSLPAPATPQDGSTPFDFTLTASDALAASLTAGKAEHQGTSPAQHVYFDNVGPAITVLPDTGVYARKQADGGVDQLTISALISDPTGVVSPQLVSANSAAVAPSFVDGGFYSFHLDAAAAPAGAQGAYGFTVRAQDGLGNPGQASGTRTIDDAPPAAAVKVFQGTEPAAAGVSYPAFAANSGHTGALFIYSDTVHVKGTLTDLSGIGAASLHLDGLELDGGVSAGVARPLGCTAGATTCSFDVQVALNDAQNGAFHTGAGMVAFDGGSIPEGAINVVVEAQDLSAAAGGAPAPHAGSTASAVATTRLLWQGSLASAVTGLAVHPSGDVIATANGGTSVYALGPDGSTRWSFGNGGLGNVTGTPAVGAGDAATALIYAAGQGTSIYALTPLGAVSWHADGLGKFFVGPALAQVAIPGGPVEAVFAPTNDGAKNSRLFVASAGGVTTSVAADDTDATSAPVVLNGNVYFGTNSGISQHAVSTLSPGNASPYNGQGGPWYNLISDGTRIFGASNSGFVTPGAPNSSGVLVGLDQSLSPSWPADTLSTAASEQPGIGLDGKLAVPAYDSTVTSIDPATGATSLLLTIPGGLSARAPLFGSDGHLYLPRTAGYFLAYQGGQLSWEAHPPGTAMHTFTMDCQGRLYAAAGSRVFAYVTDDHGLGDTPWPSPRRDSRNTANTSSPKYGIRTAAGCAQ